MPHHLLIADDDVGVLRFLRDTLASLAPGCHVDATPSPEHAFELALKRHYDLFIFDLVMPGMDGALLYRLVRIVFDTSDPPIPPVPPLLLLTGQGGAPAAQQLLIEPGVRGLLAKPFTIERLWSQLEHCLPGIGSAAL